MRTGRAGKPRVLVNDVIELIDEGTTNARLLGCAEPHSRDQRRQAAHRHITAPTKAWGQDWLTTWSPFERRATGGNGNRCEHGTNTVPVGVEDGQNDSDSYLVL
jgi:hypothetical protein